jgi:uncharacterized BrkB/YihY/UPF0761 family membrane protein
MTDADAGSSPGLLQRTIGWADRVQRTHPVAGFPYGVVKKYGEDAGGRKAALITYYGFLAIFPILLLVVVTVTRVLAGNPELRDQAVEAIVPAELRDTVQNAVTSLPTGPLPFVIGIIGVIFSASGVVFSLYDLLNQVAGVPHRDRFGMVPRYLRGFAMLLVLLVGMLAIGALAILSSVVPDVAGAPRILSVAGAVVVAFGMLLAAPKLLVARPTSLRGVWPAAAIGTVVIGALLVVLGPLLARFVSRSGPVYGSFAVIVGLFALLYLVSQVLVYAAEVAVVRRARLWPRALDPAEPTPADRRARRLLIETELRTEAEQVTVTFSPERPAPPD